MWRGVEGGGKMVNGRWEMLLGAEGVGGGIIKINEKVTLYWLWDNLTQANVYATVIFSSSKTIWNSNNSTHTGTRNTYQIVGACPWCLGQWVVVRCPDGQGVPAKYSCGSVLFYSVGLSFAVPHTHTSILLISPNKRHYYWTHTPQQFPIFPQNIHTHTYVAK